MAPSAAALTGLAGTNESEPEGGDRQAPAFTREGRRRDPQSLRGRSGPPARSEEQGRRDGRERGGDQQQRAE